MYRKNVDIFRCTFSRGGTSPCPPIPGLQGSVSSSGAQGRHRSTTLILREPGYGHRPAHSPEDLHSAVGGASWSSACGLFSGGAPHEKQPIQCRVSFADEVTMLGDATEPGSPPLILLLVEEEVIEAPVGEPIVLVSSALATSLPPPPGFSPFAWLVDDGGMDVDVSCFPFGVDCSPSLSPIGLVCSDVSDSDSPEVGVLVSPVVDTSPDMSPAVGHTVLLLPSVGPFLAERSPEYIRSLGAGCAFRNTIYRDSDYAAPLGGYGLPTLLEERVPRVTLKGNSDCFIFGTLKGTSKNPMRGCFVKYPLMGCHGDACHVMFERN